MIEALKKLNKGFLIIVGAIILLPIFIVIFLAIIQSCNRNIGYESYEEKMEKAALKYFDKKGNPKNEAEVLNVSLSTLVSEGYIKSTSKLLGDDSCKGSVTVRLNGSLFESNNGGYLHPLATLKCKDYETKTLTSYLMKDLTDQESGLYKDNFGYVYKGDSVNNYITLLKNNYVILGIDNNNIVKLLKVDGSSLTQMWDSKYNVEVDEAYGINIYKDSEMRKQLIADYNKGKIFDKKVKAKLVSYDACIGLRSINDTSINNENDCNTKLPKETVSLISISDYAKASLDKNCNNIRSRSCRNYNYLRGVNLTTWTINGVLDNTYEVYYLQYGIINHQEANTFENYNIVVYIDGNEKVKSGSGSKDSPYILY